MGWQASSAARAFTLTPVTVRIKDGLDLDEWRRVGRELLGVREASAWWIGDWLVYGEWRYRDKYRTVVDELGMHYDRLRDYAYVAGNVGPGIRRSDVPFTHHRVVAKLAPVEQRRWLEQAAKHRWTKQELAAALTGRALPAGPPAAPGRVRLAIDPQQLELWRSAADAAGLPLDKWAIRTLNQAASLPHLVRLTA